MIKLGFIGTGNLAASILKGLQQNSKDFEIYLYDILPEKADLLARQYKARACDFPELVQTADVFLLAVKPKDIKDLLQDLKVYKLGGKLIITVAAGIGLSVYEQALPGVAVVRVMPNTSCAVLQAVTGMVRGQAVTEQQAKIAEQIFSAVGKYLWVEDRQINAVTAVSGSGPAYFYLFTEVMAQVGAKLGLSKEEADFLARETLVGAGRMLAEDSRSPQELREAVTSPNGTTYEALEVFRKQGLKELVGQAMQACLKRAEEMEGEYRG
ncbi:MAG: pyrroline-5-carboxylate reductase [Peptococcaceae bacterium]|jgi:pyrroline-5-carboxylate reductase|nr:pyrroline-5-carboxylate reductase [Peptococcaceae bacterium]